MMSVSNVIYPSFAFSLKLCKSNWRVNNKHVLFEPFRVDTPIYNVQGIFYTVTVSLYVRVFIKAV